MCGAKFYTSVPHQKTCGPECALENKRENARISNAKRREQKIANGEMRPGGKRGPKKKGEEEEVDEMWQRIFAMEASVIPRICPYECIQKRKGKCGRMRYGVVSGGGCYKQVPDGRCNWYAEHQYRHSKT